VNNLLDSNIILSLVRSNDVDRILDFINPRSTQMYTSIVVEAETKSIAFQNRWGIDRLNKLDTILDQLTILDIDQSFLSGYMAIDSYSQLRNPNFTSYPFDTPRNMGKNDVWIASTAALLGLQLVTTDADFDHLNQVFLDVRRIDPVELRAFF